MAVANPEVNQEVQDSIRSHPQSKIINSLDDTSTLFLQGLCIYNITTKLRNPGKYDIGGCRQESLDLWFYCTTSICPGDNNLLNIFVCNLKPLFVSLDICSRSTLEAKENGCTLSGEYERVCMIKNGGNNHLKTYRFSEDDITFMAAHSSLLIIPIKLDICTELGVIDIHPTMRNQIKLDHNLGSLWGKGNWYDFALESKTGIKIGVHSIVLVAHSTVFKELVMNTNETFLHIDADNIYIECLIEFLYIGRLKEDRPGTFCLGELLGLAEEYKIRTLAEFLRVYVKLQEDRHMPQIVIH